METGEWQRWKQGENFQTDYSNASRTQLFNIRTLAWDEELLRIFGIDRSCMIKATYGTGSSIMMNIGEKPVFTDLGVVTSLAWSMGGKVNYVLEGNINYTGAVVTWLKDEAGLRSGSCGWMAGRRRMPA